MHEPWVQKIDCSVVDVDTLTDPDQPIVSKLSVHSTKQDRTGIAMIMIIQQDKKCLRELFANYLQDKSVDGELMSYSAKQNLLTTPKQALLYTTPLVMFRLWPEAISQAKPSQNRPGQARPARLACEGFWPGL